MDRPSPLYRSPVHRILQEAGAEFAEVNGYAIATSVGDLEPQVSSTQKLSLCDLSGLARMGVKGVGISQWLSAQQLSVPTAPNRALRQDDGSLIAMLADNEALVLEGLEQKGACVEQLTSAFQSARELPGSPEGLVVPRQHGQAWFRMTGRELGATLAKLCGVDLRPASFDNMQVAQTSVARLNAIVIRDDLADTPAFHMLADSASAAYLWECILDAGAEFDICVVGMQALQKLNLS